MILSRRVSLDGVQLDSLDNNIIISGFEEDPEDETINTLEMSGRTGSIPVSRHVREKKITVKFHLKNRKTDYGGRNEVLEKITARSVAEAEKAGDETAIEVYRRVGEKLGAGLSILIDLLNPERIVLGSIFERSGELMRESMEEVIRRETLPSARAVCRVVPAELGDRIGDFAAVAVAAGLIRKEGKL